ncbi:MAG: monovalent cation/H+ antiporter subunit A [Bradymonadaceae bacterium]|nr:monovalent cation/H+ antiporter subunit A [Lujinxingiaceae bacterium]
MTPLFIVLLPLIGVLLPLLFDRFGRLPCTLSAAFPTLMALGMLFSMGPAVMAGEVFVISWPWVESLGLNLAFRVDGLGFLFALLILGIGALVIMYAHYYLTNDDPIGRFFAYLMLFMGAMLGVVLSENVLLLAFFWEMTSLSSFLLIAYWSHVPAARQGARMALTITGLGGLGLFAGLVMLGNMVGSYDLSVILASGELIRAHELYVPMLLLVLLGAFTKSAQFPFHFWLPNAMTAPTPVSAYLHSATMVKAGVFLLARMHPALAGSSEWFFIVTGVGLLTLVFAAYVALFKHDLKGLLAYSTISHLGLITVLFGFGTKAAAIVGVFHIMNHAAFKASLFMTAGIVDHECGTRDIRVLGGLKKYMPITFVLALLGSAAMAGIPLFNGFLSKEMFFYEAWKLPLMGDYPWLVPAIATLGGLLSMAYSVRLVYDVFFGEVGETPKKPHDPPFGMMFPVGVLVAICVAVGLFPEPIIGPLLTAASAAVLFGDPGAIDLSLWHGFNAAVVMSLIAIFGGTLFFTQRARLYVLADKIWPDLTGKKVFEQLVEAVATAMRTITSTLENGSLQRYIALLLGFSVLAAGLPLVRFGIEPGPMAMTEIDFVSVVMWLILVVCSLATAILHQRRLVAVIVIGVVGLVISLAFVQLSGPDLALTQLSVEIVTILLLLLALFVLPKSTPHEGGFTLRQARDIVLAAVAGLGTALMAWLVMTRPLESISRFHLENANYPVGGGNNVVNVTLVDFRGFDTMGEISVLLVAGLGIFAMLQGLDFKYVEGTISRARDRYPVMLTSFSRPLLALIILISIYVFFRGHNMPGGGFIAGLITSVALILQYLASGIDWASERMRINFKLLAAAGVMLAVLSGMVSWLAGLPFMTMAVQFSLPVIGEFNVVSTLFFDLGVYLTVIGSMMVILSNLGHLGQIEEEYDENERLTEADPWKP